MILNVWSFLKASAEFLTLQGPPASSFIGVLDIFGFEHFKVAGEVDAKCIQVPWRLSFTGFLSFKKKMVLIQFFFPFVAGEFFVSRAEKRTHIPVN